MSGFIKIKDLGELSTSGKKVLKSADFAYYVKSQSILNESRQAVSRSQAEASELYLKSIEKGLNQGAEEAKSRLAHQMLTSASSIVKQLQLLESDLSKVVIEAVRQIINNYDDKQLVLEAVRNGLNLVSKSQKVIVRANPSLISDLRESLDNLQHSINFLEIIPDPKLTGRECVLESDIGIVDASIDSQLEFIETAINECFPKKRKLKRAHRHSDPADSGIDGENNEAGLDINEPTPNYSSDEQALSAINPSFYSMHNTVKMPSS